MTADENQWLVDRFEEQRRHLEAVAYRMLGSAPEAEEAVQDAWLRMSRAGTDAVNNLGGWMTTVVARVCLDLLEARKARPERAVGLRLPDPIVTWEAGTDPERESVLADSVGLALLIILDALSPAERLAFVLHDMFDVPFEDIAPMLGRSPTAVRQLASRARRRVKDTSSQRDADLARGRRCVLCRRAFGRLRCARSDPGSRCRAPIRHAWDPRTARGRTGRPVGPRRRTGPEAASLRLSSPSPAPDLEPHPGKNASRWPCRSPRPSPSVLSLSVALGCEILSLIGRAEAPQGTAPNGLPVVGTLGADQFLKGPTQIDVASSLLSFHAPGDPFELGDAGTNGPFDLVQGMVLVHATLNGTHVRLMFDTGSEDTLWLGAEHERGDEEVTTTDALGNPVTLYLAATSKVSSGSRRWAGAW